MGLAQARPNYQGVPVLEIFDPRPIFQIAPLPTYPPCHFACYNDIHNPNLNIRTVNYILLVISCLGE